MLGNRRYERVNTSEKTLKGRAFSDAFVHRPPTLVSSLSFDPPEDEDPYVSSPVMRGQALLSCAASEAGRGRLSSYHVRSQDVRPELSIDALSSE